MYSVPTSKWKNVVAGIFLPTGLFFYFRMWRFRFRLLRDLRMIKFTNTNIINYTEKHLIAAPDGEGEGSSAE